MLIRSIKATIFKKLPSRIFAFFLKVLHICYTWTFGHRKKPLFKGFVNSWCRQQELNPQPTDYDSVALPIELCRQRAWISYENTADMSIFFPRFQANYSVLSRICETVSSLYPVAGSAVLRSSHSSEKSAITTSQVKLTIVPSLRCPPKGVWSESMHKR